MGASPASTTREAARTARCRAGSTTRNRSPQVVGAIRIARGLNARPGSRRHALVERRPDDRDVGAAPPRGLVVGRPRQLLERAVPVRVVREIDVREFGELVVPAELAVLQPEVRRVAHGGSAYRMPEPGRPRISSPDPNTSRCARVIALTRSRRLRPPAPVDEHRGGSLVESEQDRVHRGAASSDGIRPSGCRTCRSGGTTAIPAMSRAPVGTGGVRRPASDRGSDVHSPTPSRPADEPASAAPSLHASTIASHDGFRRAP